MLNEDQVLADVKPTAEYIVRLIADLDPLTLSALMAEFGRGTLTLLELLDAIDAELEFGPSQPPLIEL
jgi:hypothetical protein